MKKGQASFDFLITYGFALIAILILIGVLIHVGYISPEDFLVDKVTFPPPVTSSESPIFTATTIQVSLHNNLGNIEIISSVEDDFCNASSVDVIFLNGEAATDNNVSEKALFVLEWTCQKTLEKGDKIHSDIGFVYRTKTGLEHTHMGFIQAKI
ncbi:hypothetical protein C0585_03550 [Candidatus Woesearchaeota archaeon]|nr:MAG: hypothetical protein C0585_03550 [Candidatus Woesearchaeota archaeon]